MPHNPSMSDDTTYGKARQHHHDPGPEGEICYCHAATLAVFPASRAHGFVGSGAKAMTA